MGCKECIYYKNEECNLNEGLEKLNNCKFYLPKEFKGITEEEYIKCIKWMYETIQ